MKNRFLTLPLLFLVLALPGCSKSVFTPFEVQVPVEVPCQVDVPPEPEYHFPRLPKGAGLFERVQALLADAELRAGYILQLKAAADACSD